MAVERYQRVRMTFETIIRMIADICMVNIALLIGLLLDYALTKSPAESGFANYAWNYALNFLLITVVSVSAFYGFGFYSRGRAYRGRYKMLVVINAVAVSYLCFGFIAYSVTSLFHVPAFALVLSAAITMVLLAGSRIWSSIWRTIVETESRSYPDMGERRIRNVLVIGGAGYVGSALLPKLLDHGYRVRMLDLFMFGDEPILNVIDHKNFELIRGDFRHIDKVVEAMQGMDAVIHLGGIVGDPACALDEEFTIEVNLTATRMIAECAKGQGIRRFIFASTCSVYGASDQILDEKSALNPVSLYARSKIACEKVISKLADDRFQPTMLRFGTIYGLSGRTRFDLVVNLLAAKAVKDGQITVFGADQWRPFVHVDDVALAVSMVLNAPLETVGNKVYNVGSDGQNKTLGDIGELVKKMVPTAELIISGTDGDRRNYQVSFAKIRNEVGFEAKRTLEYGIQQVLDAINSGEVKDYQAPQYSNVKFLASSEPNVLLRTENDWMRSLIDHSNSQTH